MLTGLLGIRVLVWVGQTVPSPPPPGVLESLSSVRVINDSATGDGFHCQRPGCEAGRFARKLAKQPFGGEMGEQILAQLLNMALANRCAQVEVALGLVGTTADLRHLARWQVYGDKSGDTPRLMQGWRAEVCGELLADVLAGKITLRIGDPRSDHPLVFERRDGA